MVSTSTARPARRRGDHSGSPRSRPCRGIRTSITTTSGRSRRASGDGLARRPRRCRRPRGRARWRGSRRARPAPSPGRRRRRRRVTSASCRPRRRQHGATPGSHRRAGPRSSACRRGTPPARSCRRGRDPAATIGEDAPVVLDADLDRAGASSRAAPASVPTPRAAHVGQRLLDDAERGQCDGRRHGTRGCPWSPG